MLEDLDQVLADTQELLDATRLRQAVLDHNLLGKRTPRTRLASWRFLNRLYGLSEDSLVTSGFLTLWRDAPEARPQLALLRAAARDPLLNLSAPWVIGLPEGQGVTWQDLAASLKAQGVNYSDKTLRSVAQNLLSSWTQAGWLGGKTRKKRVDAQWHPAAATLLLHEAYLQGERGATLYDRALGRLLPLDAEQVDALASEAGRRGWLSYRRLADVLEITFPRWDQGQQEAHT